MAYDYKIKRVDGIEVFDCTIKWTTDDGRELITYPKTAEDAETIIGLLTGNVTLSDLES